MKNPDKREDFFAPLPLVHLESRARTAGIMGLVTLALLPTAVASTIIFGVSALLVILVSVGVRYPIFFRMR